MTQEQAFDECKRRGWVKAVPMEWEGFCEITVEAFDDKHILNIVTVGRGATYEEAFANADARIVGLSNV